jgi:rare lipoprotein A
MPMKRAATTMTESAGCHRATGLRLAGIFLIAAFVAACVSKGLLEPPDDAPSQPRDVSNIPNAVPKHEPLSRYGNPASYMVYGKRYYTLPSSKGYREVGLASWYGTKFHGKRTSSGEPYDLYGMTAAHKTLPLPTYVEVTNLDNNRSVIVKVNDRGPFHEERLIDLSYTAAVKLGVIGNGTGRVEVRAIDSGTPVTASGTVPAVAPVTAQPVSFPEGTVMYLQVGAFSSRENAERLQENILAREDIKAVRVVEAPGENGTFYKVQVGPLSGSAEINQTTTSLESMGINESHPILQ